MPKLLSRIPAIIAGCVFVWSGLGKIGNIFGFQHLLVDYGLNYLNILAPFIVLFEIVIGAMLILDYRIKEFSAIAVSLLVVFTCVYSYAWIVNGVTDCGCFGRLSIVESTPLLTYIRNILLIILLILSLVYNRENLELASWKQITLTTVLVSASFVSGMTYKPFAFIQMSHPFKSLNIKQTPLLPYRTIQSNGTELMLFMSYSCPHCINSIANFKAWKEDGAVDSATAYIIVDSTDTSLDSLRNRFQECFAPISTHEINTESVDFIDVLPMAFIVVNDTICQVIQGELPSHYLYMNQLTEEE